MRDAIFLMVRTAMLITGIILLSYSVSTEGTQGLASFFGGLTAALSITLEYVER